ncbi:MAG TPA: FAD-dependent oxidoreductase [Polyangia bacterium]|nr:FAD-dependent oxidoreductase [Polyangia bacterium]
MKKRVLILGAGFAGLELATSLSESHGDAVDVTIIDKSDAFMFGFAKLDIMFGKAAPEAVRLPYRDFAKPGVTFKRETIKAIDPAARAVVTDAGRHEADILVIALGADYDVSTTPGVVLGDNEFYSVPGAIHLADVLPTFTRGHAVIGVCGAPYKCPPAPSECALMLHDHLKQRGVLGDCTITMVNPLPTPVPPSPETSKALIAEFAQRGIAYVPSRRVVSVDRARKIVALDDGQELPCDLFLGVPKNRAPDVVVAAGLTTDGWVTVDKFTLETSFPGVYALGDLANTGAPKAGVFAEGAAKTVAKNLSAILRDETPTAKNPGAGSCYIEFGDNRIARVDVDFFSGPKATGVYHEPSEALRADKHSFGATRRARWFGRS